MAGGRRNSGASPVSWAVLRMPAALPCCRWARQRCSIHLAAAGFARVLLQVLHLHPLRARLHAQLHLHDHSPLLNTFRDTVVCRS